MMNKQSDEQLSLKELEHMLGQIEAGGLKSLNSDEMLAFGRRYRQAISALSEARTHGVNEDRIAYLNQLVSRAYGHIYTVEPKGWPSVRLFFKKEFPQTFRQNLPYITTALLIFVVALLFAFGQVSNDPGTADVILGPGKSSIIDSIAERHTGGRDWLPAEWRPVASSGIMTNNIMVAATAFSTGVFAGIGTFFILFYNGLMIGVIAGALNTRGADIVLSFWSFVAPHGVIELTAIFISGGAGLLLGWALLSPGHYTRSVAVKLAAREAFKLMLGVIAMLVIAGIVEGFFSPSMIPDRFKLVVAAMLGVAQFSYLFLAGREHVTL